MKWIPSDCKSGDMIRIKLGSIYHYGIFVSENEVIQFGLPPVPEYKSNDEIKVIATSIDVFSCSQIIEVADFDKKEKHSKFSDGEIVKRARARIGEGGYNLIHNNCEHFAYECVFGYKKSSQEDEARSRWLNRPILDVYVSKIPDNIEIEDVYPKSRDEEIAKCKELSLKKAKYFIWKVLECGVSRSIKIDFKRLHFKKRISGKWICDEIKFSLSHTGNYAVAAVSNGEVGINAENIDSFIRNNNENALNAFAEQTKKKSIYKCSNKIKFAPNKIDLSKNTSKTYIIEAPERLMLSVSGGNIKSVKFFLTDESSQVRHINADVFENGYLELCKC